MCSAALNFFTGMGQGKEKLNELELKKARDKREQDEHDERMAEREREKKTRTALADASKPVTVNNDAATVDVSGKPVVYDDAGAANSDFRQARTMGQEGVTAPQQVTAVQGMAMPDQATAKTTAAAANTPQAVRQRQVAALQGIDPERAMKLEASGVTIDATREAQENARVDRAKKLKEEGVFEALRAFRTGDGTAMKDSFNKAGTFKIDGDVTITPEERELPGYGKVKTYNATFTAIGPDGKAVQKTMNSHDLSMQVLPYEKALEITQKGTKEQREARKDDSVIKENEAKAGYYNAVGSAATVKADAAATTAAGRGNKPLKLDEDDKIRLTTANTRVRDAEKAVADAMSKLMPGDDPAKNPGVAYAQKLVREAKLDHLRTSIELGQVEPASMVNQILKVAKSPKDVMQSLNELASIGGPEYSDAVAGLVQQSDAWKQMVAAKGGKAPPVPGAPAAAQGMPGAAPAAAPAPAKKTAATPDDAAGQRVDAARETLRRLQATAPGLAKGRAAIDEHAAAVQAARADLAAAEQAYQRLMEGQGANRAYFGGRPAAAAGMTASAQ